MMNFLKHLSLLVILNFSHPLFADESTPHIIETTEELVLHFESHKERLLRLGQFLIDTYNSPHSDSATHELRDAFNKEMGELTALNPEKVRVIPEDVKSLIFQFLALHDDSKVNQDEDFLNRHSLQKNEIPEGLKKQWGSTKGDVVERLNQVDQKIAYDFMQKNAMLQADGSYSLIAVAFLKFEKLVDEVDRGMDPLAAEEFGRTMERASLRFERRNQSAMKALALHLETSYPVIQVYEKLPILKRLSEKKNCMLRSLLGRLNKN